jgi:hypothetical protein
VLGGVGQRLRDDAVRRELDGGRAGRTRCALVGQLHPQTAGSGGAQQAVEPVEPGRRGDRVRVGVGA